MMIAHKKNELELKLLKDKEIRDAQLFAAELENKQLERQLLCLQITNLGGNVPQSSAGGDAVSSASKKQNNKS